MSRIVIDIIGAIEIIVFAWMAISLEIRDYKNKKNKKKGDDKE